MAKSEKGLTDLEKIEAARKRAEKAKQMQARHLQTAAKIQKRLNDKARSDDTRRKIIIGSIIMVDAMEGDFSVADYLYRRLEQKVEPRDQDLFAELREAMQAKHGKLGKRDE